MAMSPETCVLQLLLLCGPVPRSARVGIQHLHPTAVGGGITTPRDASEGKGPQRRLGRRLEEVAEAVGGGYCRLQMPLRLALAVRGTVAGHRLRARGGGGGTSPPSQCIPAYAPCAEWGGPPPVHCPEIRPPLPLPTALPVCRFSAAIPRAAPDGLCRAGAPCAAAAPEAAHTSRRLRHMGLSPGAGQGFGWGGGDGGEAEDP